MYLLGALFTAGVTAKAVRAVMDTGANADRDDVHDARMTVMFIVTGLAAIWPLTLPMYIASRIIPASTGDDDDQGIALVLAGPE